MSIGRFVFFFSSLLCCYLRCLYMHGAWICGSKRIERTLRCESTHSMNRQTESSSFHALHMHLRDPVLLYLLLNLFADGLQVHTVVVSISNLCKILKFKHLNHDRLERGQHIVIRLLSSTHFEDGLFAQEKHTLSISSL